MVTEYLLPMFKDTPHGLVCGCDMCFNEETQVPHQKIGPHDLHCLCLPCMSFCINEKAYDEALEVRYPGYETFDQLLTPEQIDQLWKDLDDSFYHSPSTSPSNSDMHAYNGNLSHQHHHGNGDFMRAAGHHLSSFADRHRYPLMLGQAGLLPAGMLYSSFQNMAAPLAELRDQVFGKAGPSNKEMHSYNGNMMPGDGDHTRLPRIDPRKAPGRDTGLHEAKPAPKITPGAKKNGGRKAIKLPPVEHSTHPPLPKTNPPQGGEWHWDWDPWGNIYPAPGPKPNTTIAHEKSKAGKTPPSTAPTNKEMHATNGNTKKYGPITKAQHDRKIRQKAKKKAKGVTVNIKNTVAKSNNNKRKNTKSHVEKIEKRLARRYAKFLKEPVYPPPRLGSTGTAPTKLLHGWFKQTFNMAAPNVGTGTPTNCTEFIAYLTPKMFKYFSTITTYAAPVTIGFADSSGLSFDTGSSTHVTLSCNDFSNVTALMNETGSPSTTVQAPGARWVGGAISVECKCPMASTAPPYAFGGLLPSIGSVGGMTTDPNEQLNRLSTTAIRNLNSTDEENSFNMTACYIPDMPNALQFDPFTAQNNNNTATILSSIPYIGLSGCPTTATVTVTASCWFEITQTVNNMNYASGWAKGPKVSSEDVFDNLPNIKPVSTKILNIGTRGTAPSVSSMLALMNKKEAQPDVHQQLDKLLKEVHNLRIQIEDEEEEKYVTASPPDTPRHNLSQSTINLALALKDRLTPGSVTSKTSRTSQQ